MGDVDSPLWACKEKSYSAKPNFVGLPHVNEILEHVNVSDAKMPWFLASCSKHDNI